MLKKIKINNFESHKKTTITLDPGVNVIVGKSDRGKSALFRSIYWCLFNKPLGDTFKSWWSDSVRVSLYFEDDTKITRKKNKTSNLYQLNTFQEPFKAFGTDPPDEILNTTRLDREVNVHAQSDSIFLLSKSSGEVARHFNKIADLDKISTTEKIATKDINQTKTKINNIETNIKDKKEELKQYNNLPDLKILIDTTKKIEDELTHTTEQIIKFFDLIKKITEIEDELQVLNNKIKVKNIVDQTNTTLSEIAGINQKIQIFVELLNKINDTEQQIKNDKIKTKLLTPINVTITLQKDIQKLNSQIVRIEKNIKLKNDITTEIEFLKNKHSQLQKKYTQEIGNECPLCNQKIKK